VPEQTHILPDVRKSVTVAATPDHCFKIFTERPAQWWPPSHILVCKERAGLAFEPGVDGRYFEWDVEGNEATWGRVLEWAPGRRARLHPARGSAARAGQLIHNRRSPAGQRSLRPPAGTVSNGDSTKYRYSRRNGTATSANRTPALHVP
jgi:hypothetical protein